MAAAVAQRVAESELFVAGERAAAANGPNNWRSLFASPKERRGCILTWLLLAIFCGQVSLDRVIRACRKDWYLAAIGAVLSSDLGAKGAPRSCPAGFIADAGLRWCGVTPLQPNGGSQCQSLPRNHHPRNRHRR